MIDDLRVPQAELDAALRHPAALRAALEAAADSVSFHQHQLTPGPAMSATAW